MVVEENWERHNPEGKKAKWWRWAGGNGGEEVVGAGGR